MNDFQSKIQEAFQQAQAKATTRAREFEQEARKVLETLSDRAQAELKTLVSQAQVSSREQMNILGIELEKLGKRLQEMAVAPAGAKAPEAAHAADGKATQPVPGSVQ